MIFYFTGALLISFVLFRLGFYAAIISLISTGGKVMAVLLLIAALVLLYRKFRGSLQLPRLPWLSGK